MKNALFLVFSLIIAAASGLAATAASVAWTGGSGEQSASNPQNWLGGAVPVSGQEITVPAGASVAWDLAGTVPSAVTSSSNLTLKAPLIVTGNLSLPAGTLKTNGFPLNIGGDLAVEGGMLEAGSDPVNVSGDWSFSSGSVSLAASTVTLNGSGNKTISSGGRHFGNLTVSAEGSTVSASDDLAVDGTLRLTAGQLSLGSSDATVQGGVVLEGGSLSLAGGSLVLSGSSGRPLTIAGGALSAQNSTVEYAPTGGSIAIEPASYGDLKLSGKAVFSLSGDASAAGTLTIGEDASLLPAGHVLSVLSGMLINQGSIAEGAIRCPALSLELLGADGSPVSSFSSSSGTVRVRVEDRDLNRNGSQPESVPGAVTVTTLGGDAETLVLVETGAASGIFQTQDAVVHQGEAKAQNGQVEIGQNDIIFVKYADPWDKDDVKAMQITANASALSASGAPQIISGPRIVNWSSQNTGSGTTYTAHIVWETDRESSSSVSVTSPQITAPIAAGSLTGTVSHDVAVSGLVRGRSYSFTVTSVTDEGKSVTSVKNGFTVIVDGDRIKSASSSAVYWYLDDKRNVFPDFTSYDSWFADWSGIVTVPAEQLASIPLGKVVPVRAGTYLVKIQSDPKTYAVEPYGRLRWVQSEAQAVALYGASWNKRVRDLDVSQFASYASGDPLADGEAPEGFVYQVASGPWNAVLGRAARQLSEGAKAMNRLSNRFVSSISPSFEAALTSGGSIIGYEPDLMGVAGEGSAKINAPAAAI